MEKVDVYNGAGIFIGKTVERYTPLEVGEFTKSVHIWIINSKGEALIQKRSENVLVAKGIWGTTGGGVLSGETPDDATARELMEELGITIDSDKLLEKKIFIKPFSLVYIYFYRADILLDEISIDPTEVAEVQWANAPKIRYLIRKKKFFAYSKSYKATLLPHIDLF